MFFKILSALGKMGGGRVQEKLLMNVHGILLGKANSENYSPKKTCRL